MTNDEPYKAAVDGLLKRAAGAAALDVSRIKLIPFGEIQLSTDRRDLIDDLIPRTGLVVVWGPPKCGKSFWLYDALMHVSLGWEYRGKEVEQGPGVYCAFEGQQGFNARAEAFRHHHLDSKDIDPPPFYLQPVTLDLVRDHPALIQAIRNTLGETKPNYVALDTLNRSLRGSESSDEDMTAYIRAADAIREAFDCVVIIVHHCGIDGSRPRGHTSLTGATDVQLSCKRDKQGNIVIEVEYAKDGPESEQIISKLKVVEVGIDCRGKAISSCVVLPAEKPKFEEAGPKLTKNQQTMYSILRDAGQGGLTAEQWNEKLREVGIGAKRKADIYDNRASLQQKHLVREFNGIWRAST